MIISLIHPSRSRPSQAKKTAEKWLHNSSGQHEIEYIVSIDKTDPQKENYIEQFSSAFYHILCKENTCVVEAMNEGAKHSTGEILICVSDDFDCPVNWDITIVNAVSYNHCYVLKTFDGIQKWIVTLGIMDRGYYESQGYFYHPSFRHMFVDADMTHKADLEGRLIIRNDIVFKHNHHSIGGSHKDLVNEIADSTWKQGEEVYLQRVKEKFGLNVDDIFKVNSEAKPHLQWLKSKLRFQS